jgi:CO dehydrogenase/acetyl-CoA synthase beta subunit
VNRDAKEITPALVGFFLKYQKYGTQNMSGILQGEEIVLEIGCILQRQHEQVKYSRFYKHLYEERIMVRRVSKNLIEAMAQVTGVELASSLSLLFRRFPWKSLYTHRHL